MSSAGRRRAPANRAAAGSRALGLGRRRLAGRRARAGRTGESPKAAWLAGAGGGGGGDPVAAMLPVIWVTLRAYAPYVTFPVAFVVGAVGYHLEWFIRGEPPPQPPDAEQSILERREDRKLQESAGKDLTQVVSLKDKLEFAPRAVLNRNRPEKN